MYYTVFGRGEPVVLLHGIAGPSGRLKRLGRALSRGFRIILPDLPGYGRSGSIISAAEDFWCIQADAVISLVEHLHAPKASLIGTDTGALTALNTGLKRPELVDKIVADSFPGEHGEVRYLKGSRDNPDTGGFLRGSLENLAIPVLFTGSLKDDCIPNIQEIYQALTDNMVRSRAVYFPRGRHPSMLSNRTAFIEIVRNFIKS